MLISYRSSTGKGRGKARPAYLRYLVPTITFGGPPLARGGTSWRQFARRGTCTLQCSLLFPGRRQAPVVYVTFKAPGAATSSSTLRQHPSLPTRPGSVLRPSRPISLLLALSICAAEDLVDLFTTTSHPSPRSALLRRYIIASQPLDLRPTYSQARYSLTPSPATNQDEDSYWASCPRLVGMDCPGVGDSHGMRAPREARGWAPS